MLEAYLFVNPLCQQCIQSEKTVLKLADTLQCKFSFRFVPMLNVSIIHENIKELENQMDLDISVNQSYKIHYDLVLDYKAASFQGKKCGRNFLMTLQDSILNQNRPYSDRLVLSIAKKSKLDLKMFKDDRQSSLAKNAFKYDQELTNEMKIQKPSSAVIFNCDSSDCGILIDEINYQYLLSVCSKNGKHSFYKHPEDFRRNFHCI
ncbi:DsbA family protein [Philodulcilactobacillus myokoensis]|uniref:DsbA family protein n=1 Tax=Philodulcilactobacillus myokoensis TaxID=2929573 RepID=A0A9W6ETI0_9LACO|nr:DsbA family protein [Philodulcilactobacillus myokoensis]GLB47034.1 DsbA family protein [Philodulcilactobacillus myokoensis]